MKRVSNSRALLHGYHQCYIIHHIPPSLSPSTITTLLTTTPTSISSNTSKRQRDHRKTAAGQPTTNPPNVRHKIVDSQSGRTSPPYRLKIACLCLFSSTPPSPFVDDTYDRLFHHPPSIVLSIPQQLLLLRRDLALVEHVMRLPFAASAFDLMHATENFEKIPRPAFQDRGHRSKVALHRLSSTRGNEAFRSSQQDRKNRPARKPPASHNTAMQNAKKSRRL